MAWTTIATRVGSRIDAFGLGAAGELEPETYPAYQADHENEEVPQDRGPHSAFETGARNDPGEDRRPGSAAQPCQSEADHAAADRGSEGGAGEAHPEPVWEQRQEREGHRREERRRTPGDEECEEERERAR